MQNKINRLKKVSVPSKFGYQSQNLNKRDSFDLSNVKKIQSQPFETVDKNYQQTVSLRQINSFVKTKSAQFQIQSKREKSTKSVQLKSRDKFRVSNKKKTAIEFFKSSKIINNEPSQFEQSKKEIVKINNFKFFHTNPLEERYGEGSKFQNVQQEAAFNKTTNAFPKKDYFRLKKSGFNQYYSSLVYDKKSTSTSPEKTPQQNQKLNIANLAFQQAYRRLEPQIYLESKDGLMTIFTCTATGSPIKRKKLQLKTMAEIKEQIKTDLAFKFRKRIPQPIIASSLQIQSDKNYKSKLESFVEFSFKVNLTNNILIDPSFKQYSCNFQRVKVYVGRGNNRNLIIALLKRRFWLEVTTDIQDKNIRFFWTQNSLKDIHSLQQSKDIIKALELPKQQQDIESFTNPEDQIACTHSDDSEIFWKKLKTLPVQKRQLKRNIQNRKLVQDPNFALFMQKYLRNFIANNKINSNFLHQSVKCMPHVITNHIPNNSFISTKKGLFYTIQRYYSRVLQSDPFKVIPKTYHFTNQNTNKFKQFLSEYKFGIGKANSIWIIKPGQCSNQGSGIFLKNISDISYQTIQEGGKYSPAKHSNGTLKTFIFQSYITNPLLYNGRKFDIRHYMMVTTVNGNLKAYWFADGYIRTSSQAFTLTNLTNRYIHLTNDAVQKHSQRYGKFEPFNKVSYGQFQRYLDTIFPNKKIDFQSKILGRMKQIGTHIIKANAFTLNNKKKMNNFEVFGLDFMIDFNLQVWLIEVNANPCLETSCPLLSRIIPNLMQQSLRLGLDPLLFPSCHFPVSKRCFLSDKILQCLKYQLIFDDSDQKTIQQLIANKQKMESGFEDVQFDEPEDEYENEGNQMDPCKINFNN